MAKKNYLVIDIAYCHDCNDCFIACKDEHYMNSWLPYTDEQERHGPRWMNIERQERGQYPRIDVNFLPKPCQHCTDAACAKAYPDAVQVREDGIVILDAEKAKGVKGLVDACPYGAIWYNEERDVAQKCTLCAHILDGKASSVLSCPRCAHSCPTGAIQFYSLDEAEFKTKAAEEGLVRYKSEISGDGLVWYKNFYRWSSHFIAGGLLKDGDCAEGVTVELKGAGAPAQVTNYFGDFWFDGLAPGTYTVVANGKDVKEVTIEKSVNIGSIAI
ncbi:MAG: (4Fe-4S)-binding protein [Clostridiales Family XIII bacterium]|jgi:Fe-S-cluster-containing dehydrogenase component|nr:(4Fe-4S)-binding protein [Clostridiales Family XIII bacterium]